MQARITLIGIQNELLLNNKSIADTWTLENETFDKDTLLYSIVNKGGTFCVVYADPDYFYMMCAYFWKKWNRTFEKWFDLFDLEYNPIENYDRYEEWTEGIDDLTNRELESREVVDEDSTSSTTTSDTSSTSSESTSNTSTTNDSDTTNTVSAFDSSTYQPHDKSVLDAEGTSNNTATAESTGTSSGTNNNTSTDDITRTNTATDDTTYTRDIDHAGHMHGNIGVTTYQKMMREEYNIQKISIYDQMADIFIRELLIGVY